MKYCGIDLHSNNSVVVVSDEEDRVVFHKRLPNDLEQIRVAIAFYRTELAGVVIESTYNWYWLVDGLMDAGYRVHLANTTAIKVRGTEIQWRLCRCGLSCAAAALGAVTGGLHLPPRTAWGARPGAQASAAGDEPFIVPLLFKCL